MPKLTLDKINEMPQYSKEPIVLSYRDFYIKVKPILSPEEEYTFINEIAEASFDKMEYSPTLRKCMTELIFIKAFVINDEDSGIDIPDQIDDLFETYNIVSKLDIVKKAINTDRSLKEYLEQLNNYIDAEIEFRKQKIVALLSQSSANAEAIETVDVFLNKLVDVVDNVNILIEKNGKKLSKHLTAKKIDSYFEQLKEIATEKVLDKVGNPSEKELAKDNIIPFAKE